MKHVITLAELSQSELFVTGQFIHVKQAQYPIKLTVNQKQYSLEQGEQVQITEGFERIKVFNLGETQEITLYCGHGEFRSGGNGRSVHITNLPAQQPVKQFGQWKVHINNPVEIANMPDFTLPDIQKVKQSGSWQVRQSGEWSIHIKSPSQYAGKPSETLSHGQHFIAGNTKRKELILKASHTNEGLIWVGSAINNGIPIRAGEALVLTTSAAVKAFAEIPSDRLHIGEITS